MTKILVIEDDRGVRTVILKLLKSEGFDVINATDGRQGVELAKEHEPDLIICDIMMPECDGYEVLNQLRQVPEMAAIPFIFLSAKSNKSDLRQGMELGADDYLTKPFTRAELLGAINARLSKQTTITQPYITEMRRAAENLGQMAYRDPLTNLPNRISFYSRLRNAIEDAKKQDLLVGVLYLNLDRFKAVNTTVGQVTGDLLLQEVAQRLSNTVSSEDTVARLSGDEFSVLLSQQSNAQDIEVWVQTISRLIAQPYEINDHVIHLQVSIGIAVYPNHGTTPDLLLNRAELAMREVKDELRGSYRFYNNDMEVVATERRTLEAGLSRALDRQELEIYYQPQVNLVTGRIIGVEALLRWRHPELGLVHPQRFLPMAEATGLIVQIGEWVLRQACTQAQAWRAENLLPIRLSVNLSARQFRHPSLVETITLILHETNLDADLLVLEMTETSVMETVDLTISTLQKLKAMGVQISIDDFGTGYSSLNYLKRFPIDILKIDQSFVQEVTTDPNDAAIAKAIIALAQSLQLKVVAEGVETEEQLHFLRQSGCHAMQGNLFSPPLLAEELEQMLLEDRRLQAQPVA